MVSDKWNEWIGRNSNRLAPFLTIAKGGRTVGGVPSAVSERDEVTGHIHWMKGCGYPSIPQSVQDNPIVKKMMKKYACRDAWFINVRRKPPKNGEGIQLFVFDPEDEIALSKAGYPLL